MFLLITVKILYTYGAPAFVVILCFQLAAPVEILGRVAAELQMKKLTYIGTYLTILLFSVTSENLYDVIFWFSNIGLFGLGIELQFEWDEVTAFVRQPDGSLFSWCERFRCFQHLIYGIVGCHFTPFFLT